MSISFLRHYLIFGDKKGNEWASHVTPQFPQKVSSEELTSLSPTTPSLASLLGSEEDSPLS